MYIHTYRQTPSISPLSSTPGLGLASSTSSLIHPLPPARPTTALDLWLSTFGLPAAHKNDDPALHCLFRSSQQSQSLPVICHHPFPAARDLRPCSRDPASDPRSGRQHSVQHHHHSTSTTWSSITTSASFHPVGRRRLLCVPVLRLDFVARPVCLLYARAESYSRALRCWLNIIVCLLCPVHTPQR